MSSRALSGLALAACASACDLSPLTSGDLFVHDAGSADSVVVDPRRDAASPGDDLGAPTPDAADAGTGLDLGPERDASLDMAMADASTPDTSTGADAQDNPCGATCGAGTFCNKLMGMCQPSTGSGMLSGVVNDKCDHRPIAALMGIAGQHLCSYDGKGSYFFAQLPFGKLELAVVKQGYIPFGTVVEIVPGGNILTIELARENDPDCTGDRPAGICSCDAGICMP